MMRRAVALLACALMTLPAPLCAAPGFAVAVGAPAGQTLTGIVQNFVPQGAIYRSGSSVVPNGSTLYFTGGCSNAQIASITGTVSGGGGFVGGWTLSGANASSFTITGSNPGVLSCNGTVAAGSYSFTISAGSCSGTCSLSATAYAGQTFFVSTASGNTSGWGNGSDSNNGTAISTPWLSINHSGINCGDLLELASSTGYAAANFVDSGSVATGCPGGDNVPRMRCNTPYACTIAGSTNGALITRNFFGIEDVVVKNATNSCIKSSPGSSGAGPTNHHFEVANSIVEGCAGSGIQTGQAGGSGNGTDYEVVIGVLAYNNSSASGPCFSGVSFAGDSDSDANSGTHRFVGRNMSWSNINGPNCNGTNSVTDGEGFINDRPDVNDSQAQITVEDNLFVGNGGRGVEFDNLTNPSGSMTVVYRNSTTAGNNADKLQVGSILEEIELQGANPATYLTALVSGVLSAQYASTTGASGTAYSILASDVTAAASAIDGNWLDGTSTSRNILNFNTGYNCPLGGSNVPSPGTGNSSNASCAHNTLLTDPVFAGSAYCTGSISTTTLTLSGCSGGTVATGMLVLPVGSTQIVAGTFLTGGSGSTWTVSQSQTLGSEAVVLLPIPPAPPSDCSGQPDTLTCMATSIAAWKPTASGATAFGGVNSSGKLGNTICDANDSTEYIKMIMRGLPADMDTCG
jgi:hypothetical protein